MVVVIGSATIVVDVVVMIIAVAVVSMTNHIDNYVTDAIATTTSGVVIIILFICISLGK